MYAIDGARMGVAVVAGMHGGASETAVLGRGDDGASLGVDATAALLSAAFVGGPVTHHAVDGACVGLASLGVDKGRTGNAAKVRRHLHASHALLGSAAASLGASVPGAP